MINNSIQLMLILFSLWRTEIPDNIILELLRPTSYQQSIGIGDQHASYKWFGLQGVVESSIHVDIIILINQFKVFRL